MQTRRYAAIILAAGFSSRMERFKPLLPLAEHTIADHVISTFENSDVDVILVTGWRQDELRASVNNGNITIVENPDFHEEMFTSVQVGIRHLQSRHEAFFIMPVDIPLVRPSTIKRMVQEFTRHPDRIVYPVFGEKRGHPPLIPAKPIPDIMGWQDGGGLKAVLASKKELALHVKVPDSNILFDIDTARDYTELLARFQHYDIPTAEECEVLLTDIFKTESHIRRHCHEVANVATRIAESLKMAGNHVDLRLIHAAAMLHGVTEETAGGGNEIRQILHDVGFGKLGDIVAALPYHPANTGIPLAAKIVFLSDVFVRGEEIVPFEKRFQPEFHGFRETPEGKAGLEQYKKFTLDVKQELEALAGQPLDQIVFCCYLI